MQCKVVCAPIKRLLRLTEKVILDYDYDFSQVTDLVRGKILCDSIEKVTQTILVLASLDPELRHTRPAAIELSRASICDDPELQIKITNAKNRLGKLNNFQSCRCGRENV